MTGPPGDLDRRLPVGCQEATYSPTICVASKKTNGFTGYGNLQLRGRRGRSGGQYGGKRGFRGRGWWGNKRGLCLPWNWLGVLFFHLKGDLKVLSGQIGSAWECYHWIALKRTSTVIWFWFFYFDLEYLRRVQSSEPLHTKMNLTSCLLGSRFV